jgi:hypothetical protein
LVALADTITNQLQRKNALMTVLPPSAAPGRLGDLIAGASSDRAREPVASPAQVAALVQAITPRYRSTVLLAAWCGLRRGRGARPSARGLDLAAGLVAARRNRVQLLATGGAFGPESLHGALVRREEARGGGPALRRSPRTLRYRRTRSRARHREGDVVLLEDSTRAEVTDIRSGFTGSRRPPGGK